MPCHNQYTVKLKHPFYSKTTKQTIYTVAVPCGKCYDCQLKRVSQWSFRLQQEQKEALHSQFVTLTYDDTNVPYTELGNQTLDPKHLQDFFKRLRYYIKELHGKKYNKKKHKIKYYAVGEYGSDYKRPHMHIILFNCPEEILTLAWTMGYIHTGTVTEASICYTLKYINKAATKTTRDQYPEFSRMSKGLGYNYLTEESILHHRENFNNQHIYVNGFRVALPRYYTNKIFMEWEAKQLTAYQKAIQEETFVKDFNRDLRKGEDYYFKHGSARLAKQYLKEATERKQIF